MRLNYPHRTACSCFPLLVTHVSCVFHLIALSILMIIVQLAHAFPEEPSSYVPRPHASTDYLVDTPEPRALLQRTFLGHNPLETMHSPYVSPASQRVLRAFYGDQFATSVESLTIGELHPEARANLRTMVSVPPTPLIGGEALERSPTSLRRPMMASPRGLSLFSEFKRACVVLGEDRKRKSLNSSK